MTATSGGAAAKAGNHYEELWVVLRVSEMLEGKASRIRLEPPNKAGTGIEFEIDIEGVTWGEQTKDKVGNWTIHRLISERVLIMAKTQLDLGRHFRFVSSTPSADLETLACRAAMAESFAEFTASLGKGREEHLAKVAEAWQVSSEEAWHLLQRVRVEVYSVHDLKKHVNNAVQFLFVGDPSSVIGELHSFCYKSLQKSFTAPKVWAHLESKGFQRRLVRGDVNVLNQLNRTLKRQQRRIEASMPEGGLVARKDVDMVLEKLRDVSGKQIVLVDGRAGSGKSTLVCAVARVLNDEGWFVAVARMDINSSLPTSDHLGGFMGLTDSPSVLLAGVAEGSQALLVIDQLDAISTYSGRMSDNFDAVDEVLGELERAANVQVLLVVRTVDLEADPRLRDLLQQEERVERHSVGKLDIEDIKEKLSAQRMDVPTSVSTLELLRIPLHFAVYCRLSDSARTQEYKTLQSLYTSYTEELRKRIERELGHLNWTHITEALVEHMSKCEVLTAPPAILDRASQLEVAALESESVLVRDDAGVSFFHESYFDYLFAQSFAASGRDLHDFLVESEQMLFRRAQTRQVLEHLAATNRQRFLEIVVELLASDRIRSHLKALVIRVLRQIDPNSRDWDALDPLAWSDSPFGSKLVTLLHHPGWFDAVDSLGHWEKWLACPRRVDRIFPQLKVAAQERPARVAELVRPYIAQSEEWRVRLRSLIGWSLRSELVDLAVELVERGQVDDARGPIAVNSDFWSILYSLKNEDPAGAARLIGAFLRRGLERAQQDGSDDPFKSGHLSSQSQSASVITDVAAAAPTEFVQYVLPFVVDIAMVDQYQSDCFLPAGLRWCPRIQSADYTVEDIVFTATGNALRTLADMSPTECATYLQTLSLAESRELRFLACRALTVMNDPDSAIDWILSDSRNLVLGLTRSERWASRDLIKTHSPYCSSALFKTLESTILNHSPEWEGQDTESRSRYRLLSALDATRMSDPATLELQRLERRFPTPPAGPPTPPRAHRVESPISDDDSVHMSDDDWLSALQEHDRDQTNWDGPVPVGGARELAHVLGSRTKEDPERFANLALRFTKEVPATAMNETLRNVVGTINLALLTELCQHAYHIYGTNVSQSVCGAISDSDEVNSELVALIARYSRDPDPQHETANTETGEDRVFTGLDLFTAGLNSTRGQAALAAASILFAGADHTDTLLPLIEALAQDEVLAVRTCAAEAAIALLNHAPSQALNVAEQLFEGPIAVLDANTSERLLTHAVLRDPQRFAPVLATVLNGPTEIARRGGRIWAVAHLNERLPLDVAPNFQDLTSGARRGAAEVFAVNVNDSLNILPHVFNDHDPEVRQISGTAMRNLDQCPASHRDALIDLFMTSKAFPTQMGSLIYTLESMTSRLPPNTITVCELAVNTSGSDLGDIRTAASVMGSHIVTIILRLYKQGNANLKSRCLNVIDRLTELDVYEVAQALDNER